MARKDNINQKLISALEKEAFPLRETGAEDEAYDSIIRAAAGKEFVLIGEATHGTREFYRIRAELTERLIEEQEFDAVVVEADWPNAYAVNRYVSAQDGKKTAQEALGSFGRFPSWMWRNTEVLHFVEWLKAWNRQSAGSYERRQSPVGFYGLDLYSLHSSIHAVIAYLEQVDPDAAIMARDRYACFDHFTDNPQAYGYAAEFGLAQSCEVEILSLIEDLRKSAWQYMSRDGFVGEDEYFCAMQNARLVRNAEQYYRSMFRGRVSSWNLRDGHMFSTLEDLAAHLGKRLHRKPRIVVWAHNSHIGNAAATEMGKRGEFNLGQLVRSNYGDRALLIGFSTCRGTVTAASDWDMPAEVKTINDSFPGSYEEIFHHVSHKNFFLNLREANEAVDLLMEPKLQRAIGVIYRPDTERGSHYFYSTLPLQFDYMIHLDETSAVEPMDAVLSYRPGEMDETYPSGL